MKLLLLTSLIGLSQAINCAQVCSIYKFDSHNRMCIEDCRKEHQGHKYLPFEEDILSELQPKKTDWEDTDKKFCQAMANRACESNNTKQCKQSAMADCRRLLDTPCIKNATLQCQTHADPNRCFWSRARACKLLELEDLLDEMFLI